MTQNVSRELLALACVAFRAGEFDTAGSLFADAMSASDSVETILSLLPQDLSTTASEELEEEPTPELDSLASISRSVSMSMERAYRTRAESGLDSDVGSHVRKFL